MIGSKEKRCFEVPLTSSSMRPISHKQTEIKLGAGSPGAEVTLFKWKQVTCAAEVSQTQIKGPEHQQKLRSLQGRPAPVMPASLPSCRMEVAAPDGKVLYLSGATAAGILLANCF